MPLRPLTEQEIRDYEARGWDMSGYDGSPIQFPDPPPTSALAAGVRSAAASAIPTLAGGAGFAGGMAAGALAGGAAGLSGGPLALVTVPAGLVAGGLAGYAAGKAQEAMLPDSVNQQLTIDQQQHPVATTVGSLATLPLGGMNPSSAGPKAIASAIARRSINPQEIGIAARQALNNAVIGASLGAIQTGVEEKLHGQDLNPAAIAQSAVLGTVLTKPNAIGKFYNFHPLPERTLDTPESLRGTLRQSSGQVVMPEKEPDVRLPFIGPKQPAEVKVPEDVGMTMDELTAATHTQKDSKIRTPYTFEIDKKLKDAGLELSPDYVATLNRELLAPHQIKLAPDSNLKAKGQAFVSKGGQRIAKINPTRFSADTIPHEDFHHAYADWQAKAANGDKQAARDLAHLERLSKPGLDAINEKRVAAGKTPWSMEEFVVSEQGNEFINQQLDLQNETGRTGWTKWVNDTKALLATRGENPTLEQARRAANFRRVNEVTEPGKAPQFGPPKMQEDDKKPFGPNENPDNTDTWSKETWDAVESEFNHFIKNELPIRELKTKLNKEGSQRNQGQDEGQQAEDFTRYNNLINSLKGKSLTEAFPIASEIEQIKNKYGGKPPTLPLERNEQIRQDQQDEIKQLYGRSQGDNEGLDAERIVFNAAKTTDPYKQWKLKQAKQGLPTDDDAFRDALEKDANLQADMDTEPAFIAAINQAVMQQNKAALSKPQEKPVKSTGIAPINPEVEKRALQKTQDDYIAEQQQREARNAAARLAKEKPLTIDEVRERNKRLMAEMGIETNEQKDAEKEAARVVARTAASKIQGPPTWEEARPQWAKEIAASDAAKLADSKRKAIEESNRYLAERKRQGRFQESDDDSEIFTTRAIKLLTNPKESKLPFNNASAANGNQLLNSLRNQLSPAEYDMLKQAGIENAWQGKIVNRKDAIEWVKKNGPKVRLVSYGMEGKVSEAKREYDRMTHEWYDNLSKQAKADMDETYDPIFGADNPKQELLNRGWRPEEVDKALRYGELIKTTTQEPRDTSPRATTAYEGVSAFNTHEPMPEWTTSKEGRNVQRVDVVIPQKDTTKAQQAKDVQVSNIYDQEKQDRLNKESGTFWQPDPLHENLPNTLGWAMIQYKTGPKGEKMAVIVEAQSRWGQEVREAKKRNENLGIEPRGANESEYDYRQRVNDANKDQKRLNADHPLLRDYNRLILKAAIEQARKEGATHIVVSDAETAMMSEWHDRAQRLRPGEYQLTPEDTETLSVEISLPISGKIRVKENINDPRPVQVQIDPNAKGMREPGAWRNYTEGDILAILGNSLKKLGATQIGQEPGMRLNYDEKYWTLADEKGNLVKDAGIYKTAEEAARNAKAGQVPKEKTGALNGIMQELTGSKGERVSLGEHKNAMELRHLVADSVPAGEELNYYKSQKDKNYTYEPYTYASGKTVYRVYEETRPRPNLIFKNPDGTPKIDVSGMAYDIRPVSERLAKGDKFTLFNKYQEENEGLDPWINKGKSMDLSKLNEPSHPNPDTSGKPLMALNKSIDKDFDKYDKLGITPPRDAWHTVDKVSQMNEDIGVEGKNWSRNQEDNEGLRANDMTKQGLWRGASSAFDRVREVSIPISEAFKRWEAYRDKIWGHAQTSISDLQSLDRKAVDKAFSLHREIFRHAKESEVEARLRAINSGDGEVAKASRLLTQYYHDKIGNIRRELGYRHDGRLAGLNKSYVPDVLNDRVLDIFVNKSQSPETEQLKTTWANHVFKESKGELKMQDIRKNINEYVDALGGARNQYKAVNFGALRKAEGYGLPEAMRETDAVKSLSKYGRRAANDMATFKELEMNPKIANALKLRNPITNNFHKDYDENVTINQASQIKDAMKWVTGNFSSTMSRSTPQVQSAVRVVNNALLGTATGLRDTVSIPMNAVPYITSFADLQAFMRGVSNFRRESRNALETAAKQPNLDKLQFDALNDAPDKFSHYANTLATLLRRYQGREALENFNRDVTFAAGKELAKQWIIGARAGHKGSIEMLKKFDTLVEGDVTKLSGEKLEEALNQIGKNFTDRNQGTYGGRGLPNWMIDSQFAPFFALQKWSVEKSNVIYKDVLKPALERKNFVPLLTYTAGSVLTGAAIQQLNELLTNRKAQDPTIKEAATVRTPHAIVSELATIMQLGSYMGIVGDAMKGLSDVTHGKTPRNIVSFPTATFAADTGERTMQMIEAINQGENPLDVISQWSIDLMTKNVQAARMIANHTVNEQNVERSDKFRDVRVFNELEGNPASAIATTNPYLNYLAKKFKQTSDAQEAYSMLPELLSSARSKAGQDYEKLSSNLRGLKANSYQTMPSPERQPLGFQRYYQYLVATQGKEAADARLKDYMRQSRVNTLKASLVPSL